MKSNYLTMGILAHVDAGKTTLAEGLLYLGKKIRKRGRVDHKDAFFDYGDLERDRGITIFSKTAVLPLEEHTADLLDTPGHVDFSAEMERALSVMDYAILIISGTDGVQSHSRTVFELIRRYHVPAFVFVNKMDRPECDRQQLMQELRRELSDSCVDFTDFESRYQNQEDAFLEELAVCDETWMEEYLAEQELTRDRVCAMISSERIYPCFFGSALHMDGVEAFYHALGSLTRTVETPGDFSARVFKIRRDEKGSRLVMLKITGGTLRVRDEVQDAAGNLHKIHQIRIYEGERYETVSEAEAGRVAAVTGLDGLTAGEILVSPGAADTAQLRESRPVLKPVLRYTIVPELDAVDGKALFGRLMELSEELPELSVSWEEQTQSIQARLMGEVQIEILQALIRDRFDTEVRFEQGRIVYQETIAAPVIGIGHFEPIRHYAEVHVLIEPAERGSGVHYVNRCPDGLLERGWQQTAMRHLKNREHKGVLTGSVLTDVTISLIAGRSHKKHSEGQDFMEAAHRAVRQGLMQAESVLLEPYVSFRLIVPAEQTGRAMTDIQAMGGSSGDPVMEEERTILSGRAPLSTMQEYARTVSSYTGGRGSLSMRFDGYDVCGNAKEVIAAIGYQADADLSNPSSSLFFRQGAAVYVPWQEVADAARTDSGMTTGEPQEDGTDESVKTVTESRSFGSLSAFSAEDRELYEIFERTYGSRNAKQTPKKSSRGKTDAGIPFGMQAQAAGAKQKSRSGKTPEKNREDTGSWLLVDGYNIIHAWEELRSLAAENLDSARDVLMDLLSDYQGSRGGSLILVFDAYRVKGGREHTYRYHNIDVVFTREAETADAYIERVTKQIAGKQDVTVATSDGLEQIIIWGHGAKRMSAPELKADVEEGKRKVREIISSLHGSGSSLFEHLDDEDAEKLEKLRLGQ